MTKDSTPINDDSMTIDSVSSTPKKHIKKKKKDVRFFSYENLKSLAILIVAILAIRWSVFSPYVVPTASMEPTIKVGDRLLGWKMAYDLRVPFTDITVLKTGMIKRGNIIIFRYPRDPSIDYVKRVVGLPGDKIQLLDDTLYINGVPQEKIDYNHQRQILDDIKDHSDMKLLYKESLFGVVHWVIDAIPSLRHFSQSTWPSENEYYQVPLKHYFVMGDNRHNSADSRVFKSVPENYIRGKALFVIWSMYQKDNSWWPIFRWSRFGHWLE